MSLPDGVTSFTIARVGSGVVVPGQSVTFTLTWAFDSEVLPSVAVNQIQVREDGVAATTQAGPVSSPRNLSVTFSEAGTFSIDGYMLTLLPSLAFATSNQVSVTVKQPQNAGVDDPRAESIVGSVPADGDSGSSASSSVAGASAPSSEVDGAEASGTVG